MATKRWVTIGSKWCELVEADVTVEEQREFPAGSNRELGLYLVLGRRCSADIACNLAGISCSGAYTNPGVDRFELDA